MREKDARLEAGGARDKPQVKAAAAAALRSAYPVTQSFNPEIAELLRRLGQDDRA